MKTSHQNPRSGLPHLAWILISSLVLPHAGMAAEDISFAESPLHIRTLAASCSACHGTLGNAVENSSGTDPLTLAGLKSSDIAQRLMEFRSGARQSTVMHRHAKGLTIEEINQLSEFFSRQKPTKHAPPKPHTFKGGKNE